MKNSERRTNYEVISASVLEYLDSKGFTKKASNVFHVVLFSAGGGTGSITGPVLSKALVERGIPTILVAVGDDTTGSLAQNTANTLATIQNFSKMIKKPLVTYYRNNTNNKGNNISERLVSTDNNILTFLAGISLFLSGENFNLDNQDLITLIDFTPLTSINLSPGAYNINIYSNTISDNDHDYFIGRTLTYEDISPDPGIKLLHWKQGAIINPNVLNTINRDELPLHLVLGSGVISEEVNKLKVHVQELKDIASKVKPDDIHIDDDAIETDGGMVI